MPIPREDVDTPIWERARAGLKMRSDAQARVLLAEDNAVTVEALTRLLSDAGHACTHVRGGASAYRAFCEAPYQLVITDLNMAGGDGYVLIERIREISGVPILVVTGINTTYSRQKIQDFENVAVLIKPLDGASFLSKVAELLTGDIKAHPHNAPKVVT